MYAAPVIITTGALVVLLLRHSHQLQESFVGMPLRTAAAAMLGCALTDSIGYFKFLNQITEREQALYGPLDTSWLGIPENLGGIFWGAVGQPLPLIANRWTHDSSLQFVVDHQPNLSIVLILRIALVWLLTASIVQVLLRNQQLRARVGCLCWSGVGGALLIALAWILSRRLPAGHSSKVDLSSLYVVVTLSLLLLALAVAIRGYNKNIAIAITGPGTLVLGSALLALYFALNCATKLNYNYVFAVNELWDTYQTLRCVLLAWGVICTAIHYNYGTKKAFSTLSDIRGLLGCGVALLAFWLTRPLAADAALTVVPAPSRLSNKTLHACAPLSVQLTPIVLGQQRTRRSYFDLLQSTGFEGFAIYVSLDERIEHYLPGLCNLCGWERPLHLVAEHIEQIPTQTAGELMRSVGTCSVGQLKLDCNIRDDEHAVNQTFRELVSVKAGPALGLFDACHSPNSMEQQH